MRIIHIVIFSRDDEIVPSIFLPVVFKNVKYYLFLQRTNSDRVYFICQEALSFYELFNKPAIIDMFWITENCLFF